MVLDELRDRCLSDVEVHATSLPMGHRLKLRLFDPFEGSNDKLQIATVHQETISVLSRRDYHRRASFGTSTSNSF